MVVPPLHHVADLLQADALHPADRVGEVLVDHVLPDAHRLEDLGRLVGLQGGDPHFGGDLHDAVEDGAVVVVDGGVGVLVQQLSFHQLLDALLGQIGVHRRRAEAQQGGEVVDLPGLGGLQHDGQAGALLGADQILLQGGDRQQRRDGHMVFVHAPVGQDDDVCPVAVGTVYRDEHAVNGTLQRGVLIVEQGDGLHLKARTFMARIFIRSMLVRMGFWIRSTLQFSGLPQQVASRPQMDGRVGDDLLPDGVDGRVGHLGEHLLEVVEQGLVLLGQDGQGDVHAHGCGGLCPGLGHLEDGVFDLLVGIAEGLVQPVPVLLAVGGHRVVGDGQVLQVDQILVQPLPVGLPPGVALLQLIVRDEPSCHRVHQQHLARLETGFFDDLLRRELQHAHLGGEDQLIVVGDVVPGGTQAVSVQHRAHQLAVGEQDGRRAVPGLHHGGVIAVHVPLFPAHGPVVFPGLRDREHHPAMGSSTPFMVRNSSVLSRRAESEPLGLTTG